MTTPTYQWKTITTKALDGLMHPDRKNKHGVLFVHGFWGGSLATWKAEEAAADFCELIYDDPALVDYDVFRFNYRTGLIGGDAVPDVAQQLRDRLKSKELSKYKLVLVAHSMGGLVSMRCILDFLKAGEQPNVIGLLLYGTPTNGADWIRFARAANVFVGFKIPLVGGLLDKWFASHKQLIALERASDFIQALTAEWALRVINGGNQIEEAKRRLLLPVKVVIGTKDMVVPVDSAKGNYGEIAYLPIPFGHIELVKPPSNTDFRYQAAQGFLESCLDEKPPEVLLRLRTALDETWKSQSSKLIRDWRYEVHLNGKGPPPHADLANAGFAPCAVTKCEYRMILEGPLHVGVTYGRTAAIQAWDAEPRYVHQIIPDSIPQAARNELCVGLDKVTARSPEDCWRALFPSISLAVEASDAKRFELKPGSIAAADDRLLRTFELPAEASNLVGEEVTLSLKYESVAPRALTTFNLFFPWLTDGCNAQVTIHDAIEFLPPSLSLGLQSDVKVAPEVVSDRKATVLVKTKDVLLPNSSVEIRWQRK